MRSRATTRWYRSPHHHDATFEWCNFDSVAGFEYDIWEVMERTVPETAFPPNLPSTNDNAFQRS